MTAQTEENSASFVLQRLTTFRQTEINIVCYDLLMPICFSWLTVETPYLHHIATILLAKNTYCEALSI